jgi:hypothetical protein
LAEDKKSFLGFVGNMKKVAEAAAAAAVET